MKRIISLCVVLVLIFTLSACDNGKEFSSEIESSAPSSQGVSEDVESTASDVLVNTTSPESTADESDGQPTNDVEDSTVSETPKSTHKHKFSSATCTEPQKCACGETKGNALGHKWIDATCKAPKTCKACKETEGKALEHNYSKGVCKGCGKKDPDYKPVDISNKKGIKKIVDESKEQILETAFEEFYRDDTYCYTFSSRKSSFVIVYYNNGTKETVKEALKKGKIKLSDLDKWNIRYYKDPIVISPNKLDTTKSYMFMVECGDLKVSGTKLKDVVMPLYFNFSSFSKTNLKATFSNLGYYTPKDINGSNSERFTYNGKTYYYHSAPNGYVKDLVCEIEDDALVVRYKDNLKAFAKLHVLADGTIMVVGITPDFEDLKFGMIFKHTVIQRIE